MSACYSGFAFSAEAAKQPRYVPGNVKYDTKRANAPFTPQYNRPDRDLHQEDKRRVFSRYKRRSWRSFMRGILLGTFEASVTTHAYPVVPRAKARGEMTTRPIHAHTHKDA